MANQPKRRTLLQAAALAACTMGSLVWSSSALALDWPTKPVRIVVAIGPGSSGDTLSRLVAPRLEAIWKQPVIVENKPGAGGVVGTEHVVRATDGHTLMMATQSSILPKYTQKGLRFDPLTDLVPVRKVLNYQLIIASSANAAKEAKTLKDLVALSQKNGTGLFLSGTGPTSVFNLSFAILNQQLGMKYTAVNFNSINDMNLAVMRGDAQLVVNNPASVRPFFANGSVVPVAAISTQRYPGLPEVPTLKEAVGYSGYLPQLWAGLLVPKDVPAAVVERINRDVATIFEDAEFRKQVEDKLSATVVNSSPSAFSKDIKEETAVWQDLFKTLNIKPE